MKKNKPPIFLLIPLAWTLILLVFLTTPSLSDTSIRMVLTIPMLLFIPGYMLAAVIYPKIDDLDTVERIALSFGFSIADAPLIGLFFYFTSGIELTSILIALCLYTEALILVAAYRLGRLSERERFSGPFHRIYKFLDNEFSTIRSRKDIFSTGILIFFIALATGMMYFVITTPGIGERFTEFYILGPGGKADNYTIDLKYNSPARILAGVINHEYASVNYTVQVALEKDVLTDTWFSLNHNETWERNINFVPDKTGKDMKLEFWLYKEDNFTAPYRELYLWVNITK